ncbi:MAG: hypothetical protein ACR2QK_07890, partial [Acidimicrobiales bacterium]
DATAIVALIGGAWFAYKVAFGIPPYAVLALVLALVGIVTGSLIRFNVVKLAGRPLDDAGRGYGQLFSNDVEYVVTGNSELGSTAIRLLTIAHIMIVPILVVAAWFAIARAGHGDEYTSSRPSRRSRKPDGGGAASR